MKGFIFCVFAIMMLTPAQGEEDDQGDLLSDQAELLAYENEDLLECFRCDLGFWDACYTTTTNCSYGEMCYTGRGKAADFLDIKTLGCVKKEQCDTVTTVELFPNSTVYYITTKFCCDTPYCNSANKLPINILLLTAAVLGIWGLTEASTG